MIETSQLPAQRSRRLVDQVSSLRVALAQDGIDVTDMSRAGSLEQGLAEVADIEATSNDYGSERPVELVRLEGPIVARAIVPAAPGVSRFRYFLDGTQKSIPVGRIGLDPIVVALSAAGILARDEGGQPRLLGNTLRVNQTWIVPQQAATFATRRLTEELARNGITAIDPFVASNGQPIDAEPGDYARTLRIAFDLAGELRANEERALIDFWTTDLIHESPDEWLVIDGPRRDDPPRAVGLVKSLGTQHLRHDEAVALFNMPSGHRTSAFRFVHSSDDQDSTYGSGKTMWFMRLWSATGMDARHSLVRIDAPNSIASTEQIDEISSWILAERLPRATEDPRWPTLLYPIHYLERILKRRLSTLTTGWPSA